MTIDKEPSEKEWASACGLTHLQLRHLLQNGENARAKLIAKNGGLVVSIAKRYHNRNTGSILTLQDIIQEGNLGLMVAAERFDPSRGFKFATYAGWWVRQRILRCIADHSRVIRLPTHGKFLFLFCSFFCPILDCSKLFLSFNSSDIEVGRN